MLLKSTKSAQASKMLLSLSTALVLHGCGSGSGGGSGGGDANKDQAPADGGSAKLDDSTSYSLLAGDLAAQKDLTWPREGGSPVTWNLSGQAGSTALPTLTDATFAQLQDALKSVKVKASDNVSLNLTIKGVEQGKKIVLASNDKGVTDGNATATKLWKDADCDNKVTKSFTVIGSLLAGDGSGINVGVKLCALSEVFEPLTVKIGPVANVALTKHVASFKCAGAIEVESSNIYSRPMSCSPTPDSDVPQSQLWNFNISSSAYYLVNASAVQQFTMAQGAYDKIFAADIPLISSKSDCSIVEYGFKFKTSTGLKDALLSFNQGADGNGKPTYVLNDKVGVLPDNWQQIKAAYDDIPSGQAGLFTMTFRNCTWYSKSASVSTN